MKIALYYDNAPVIQAAVTLLLRILENSIKWNTLVVDGILILDRSL